MVLIDPTLRRGTATAGAVAAAAAQQAVATHLEPQTMATTASCLARAFGIVVRQIADLLTMLQDCHQIPPRTLEITFQESIQLQVRTKLSRSKM